MVKVRLTAAARDDLRDVRTYSKAAFGPIVTREYLDGFRSVFDLLREQPWTGSSQDDLGPGIRAIHYRSHRIFYRVAPTSIEIVRILHHAQDARLRLSSQ